MKGNGEATAAIEAGDEKDGKADAITLASLQSQINDLKRALEQQQETPLEKRLQQLEEGWLSVADLFSDLRLSCFGRDRREDVGKVAAIAVAIREQRKG